MFRIVEKAPENEEPGIRVMKMGFLQFRPPWNKRAVNCPEDLWEHFVGYVEHSNTTALVEEKVFSAKDGIRYAKLDRLRPLTIEAFCNYLGIGLSTWKSWKSENAETQMIELIEMIELNIADHQFQGAAVDVFNATMISRKLGLAEKTETYAKITEEKALGDEHLAVHVHPDDPDPLDAPRPLYSLAQIEAGVPFTAPRGLVHEDAMATVPHDDSAGEEWEQG